MCRYPNDDPTHVWRSPDGVYYDGKDTAELEKPYGATQCVALSNKAYFGKNKAFITQTGVHRLHPNKGLKRFEEVITAYNWQ